MNRTIVFLLMLCTCLFANAQEVIIKEFKELSQDLAARTNEKLDANGNACALVKVVIPMQDVQFEGWVIDQQYTPGEYWVYLPEGAPKLKIKHSDLTPLVYEFPENLLGKHTYQMILGFPESNESLVKFMANVKNAQMDIAGQHLETETGSFDVRLPKGKYDYVISTTTPGFSSVSGQIIVDDVFKEERVNLSTVNTFKLTINADEDSRIKIDNIEQQKRGSQILTIPAGLHTVEAIMGDGDRWSKCRTVDLTNENVMVDLSMRGNLRITYPANAEFEITPINNALAPSKKTYKTGETIALLGDYSIKVIKKNYTENFANVTVHPNDDIDNFHIDVISNGDNYFRGINGFKQDYKKAFNAYEKLAKKGDDNALFMIASCYDKGLGVDKNLAQAIMYYKRASAAGHNEASYRLAELTEDQVQRANYYILAANQGNLQSMKIVGDYFFARNEYAEALKFYSKATKIAFTAIDINKADSLAIAACSAAVGDMYFQGNGVDRDLEVARSFFNQAAAMDNPLAKERLIDYIYFGLSSTLDKEFAINRYKQLGDSLTDEAKLRVALSEFEHQRYVEANTYFSYLFNSNIQLPEDIGEVFVKMGEKMYNNDLPAAFYYYSTAQKYGTVKPRQMVRLGYMYMNGKGTGVDYDLAKDAFEKASLLNDNEGTCMLGYLYEKGRGVAQSKERAIELYLKAGKAGYMKAYNNLGTLYANLKDMDKAVYYWELSAKAKNKAAIANLIKYYSNRKNKEKEEYWKKQQ